MSLSLSDSSKQSSAKPPFCQPNPGKFAVVEGAENTMSVTYKKVLTGDRSSVWVIPTVDNPCVLWTFGAGLNWLTAFPPSEFSCGTRNQPASWGQAPSPEV